MDALLRPRSVAVVGASRREQALGTVVVRNLQSLGFPGSLYRVNPRYEELDGERCFPNLPSLPETPDAVFVALPAAAGPAVVAEAGSLGVRAAYVNASGYADGGDHGRALQAELESAATTWGMAVCGPNNTGAINFVDSAAMWTAPMPATSAGKVAVLSQSGSLSMVLAEGPRSLGLSFMISAGNEAVLSVADYLAWIVKEGSSTVVVLFLETIRRPDDFASAAVLAAEAGLPIVALKVGRSEAARSAIRAHTGALAGDDRAYDAFFRRCGVVRARDLDELIELANLFGTGGSPKRAGGLAALTLSGGEAALFADAVADAGLVLPTLSTSTVDRLATSLPEFASPQNPLDAFGLGFDIEQYSSMTRALLDDPAVSTVVALVDAPASGGIDAEYALAIADVFVPLETQTNGALVMVNTAAGAGVWEPLTQRLRGTGVALLTGLRESVAALTAWHCRRGPEVPSRRYMADLDSVPSTDAEWMAELSRAGVAVVPNACVKTVAEAVSAAERMGFPVAVKGLAPGLLHKTDAGVVSLDLRSAVDVMRASEETLERLAQQDDAAILVQRMVGPGVEVFAGVRDSSLGQLLVVGAGGVLVELLDQVAVRMAPVDERAVTEMLRESGVWGLLSKATGGTDVAALSTLIAAFSQLAVAAGRHIRVMEINPVIVLDEGDGAYCVDVAVER